MPLKTLGVGLAGSLAAAAVWMALALFTGLIFHFMPAAPPMAGAALVAWRLGTPTLVPGALVVAFGALVALVASLLIVRLGRPLDDPLWTGAAIVAGAVIGSIVAWRAGGARGSIATTDDAG